MLLSKTLPKFSEALKLVLTRSKNIKTYDDISSHFELKMDDMMEYNMLLLPTLRKEGQEGEGVEDKGSQLDKKMKKSCS